MIDKTRVFAKELLLIEDKYIRETTEKIITELPDYFFRTAASSTGKYHPKYALGDGGLVRHTKAAVKICADLLSLDYNQNKFTQEERDLMIAALILHDGMKHGLEGSKYTVADHPVVMADYIRENHYGDFPESQLVTITDAIAAHMGQWNTDYKTGEEIMPKPVTEMQYFVHMCDYLASRKYLIVEFENYYEPRMLDVFTDEDAAVTRMVTEIISVCRAKIADGADREELYKIIESISGEKDPRKIIYPDVAEKVLAAVKDYKSEEDN